MIIRSRGGNEIAVVPEDYVLVRRGNYEPHSEWEFAYDIYTGKVYGGEVTVPFLGISPRDVVKLPAYWGEVEEVTQRARGYVTERTYTSLCSTLGAAGYVCGFDVPRRLIVFRPLIKSVGTPRMAVPLYRSTFVGARTLEQCLRYARYGRDWRIVSVEVDRIRLGVFAVTRGLRELQAVITCWCGEEVDVSPLEEEVFGNG
jgi:hypothetical protein